MDDAFEKFSPLTPEEIAAAPAVSPPARKQCDGQLIATIPVDAPPINLKFKGRKPDEIFWFRAETGGRLFAEVRWNLGDRAKEVRPACFTGKGWKLVAYPTPRPLYNLDKLYARPDEPVWLFEGPRKADRAEGDQPRGDRARTDRAERHWAEDDWASGAFPRRDRGYSQRERSDHDLCRSWLCRWP